MWDPDQQDPLASFIFPVTGPTALPADSPTVCVPINVAWLPFVVGAVAQLLQPQTWNGVGVSIQEMQARATDLLAQFINADPCVQFAIRFVSGCALQTSLDGGTTWTTVPGWLENFPACVEHYVAVSGRLVMTDGPNSPPVPIWNESGTDWIYEG